MSNAALTISETDYAAPAIQPAPSSRPPMTPVDMLGMAIERGAGPEALEKMTALYERWEAGQARKAFDAAVSSAKGKIPPIFKNKTVDFTSQKGRTNYRHEDFAEIARTVDPILNDHGLSYRHRATQDGNKLRVTCILSHRDGYSEETTLEATEDHSGNKNSIQAIGSAATYLQRYTLKLALGLATSADDDGQGAQSALPINEQQIGEIIEVMDSVGADKAAFLRFFKVQHLAELPAVKFEQAMGMLNAKRGRA